MINDQYAYLPYQSGGKSIDGRNFGKFGQKVSVSIQTKDPVWSYNGYYRVSSK